MSLSKSNNISRTNLLEEFDSADRVVMFYLHTRPIDDVVLGYAVHRELHHWALVAIFMDELVRTMEGIESEGMLIPKYYKERPPNALRKFGEYRERPSNGDIGKYWELIAMISSPYKLREVAMRNRLNDTPYSATTNNCQEWVKAAANAISPNLAVALENYRTNGELNILERAAKCCLASSRSSKDYVTSTLKNLAKRHWSNSTNLEEHKLE